MGVRGSGLILVVLASCYTNGPGPAVSPTQAAVVPTPKPPDGPTFDECRRAYAHPLQLPRCKKPDCTSTQSMDQLTIPEPWSMWRRDRSCARLRAQAWTRCALRSTTYPEWLACPNDLRDGFLALPDHGPDAITLERGRTYVVFDDIVSVVEVGVDRAVLLDLHAGTDVERRIAVRAGDEVRLDHEFPTPPQRPEIAVTHPDGTPDFSVAVGTHRVSGAAYRVRSLDARAQRVVIEPMKKTPFGP